MLPGIKEDIQRLHLYSNELLPCIPQQINKRLIDLGVEKRGGVKDKNGKGIALKQLVEHIQGIMLGTHILGEGQKHILVVPLAIPRGGLYRNLLSVLSYNRYLTAGRTSMSHIFQHQGGLFMVLFWMEVQYMDPPLGSLNLVKEQLLTHSTVYLEKIPLLVGNKQVVGDAVEHVHEVLFLGTHLFQQVLLLIQGADDAGDGDEDIQLVSLPLALGYALIKPCKAGSPIGKL